MFDKENFKLSILIPCYNEVSSIDLIINKVLKNLEFYNFSNYEIVIVDDFSNDGTKKKLEMFSKNEKFRIILHDHNQGKGAAIRTGIKNIDGDILKIAPKLENQIDTLIESAQNTNNTDNITDFRDNLDGLKDALYENVEKLSDKQSKYTPEIDETIVYAMVDNFFSDILTEYANNCPGKNVGALRKEIKESMEFLANESDLKRYMTTEESGRQLAYPGVKFKVRTKTKTKLYKIC